MWMIWISGLVSLEDTAKRAISMRITRKLSPAHTPFYKNSKPETETFPANVQRTLEKEAFMPWKDKIQNCKFTYVIKNNKD